MMQPARMATFMGAALLTVASAALASDGLFWVLQDTRLPASTPGATELAMRTGQAWPVIFDRSQNAFTLYPTPNPHKPDTHWHEVFEGNAGGDGIVAKSSANGQVLAVFNQNDLLVGGPATGWSLYDAEAAAFDASGDLWRAENGRVVGLPEPDSISGAIVDMAVSSEGTIGVVTESREFIEYRGGQWSEPQRLFEGLTPINDSFRLVYDALSRPHVAAITNETLLTADFSTTYGGWLTSSHGRVEGQYASLASTAVGDGEVGLAFSSGGGVMYRWLDNDLGQWKSDLVVGTPFDTQAVGLDFDYAGLPVISYIDEGSSGSPTYHLAYDPRPVPEPTGLALFSLAAAGLIHRRVRRG